MNIGFKEFSLTAEHVAQTIYRNLPHRTINRGVTLGHEVVAELRDLLTTYNQFVRVEQTPYYRIDAYVNEDKLWVLEINAKFVDGWGTALNLARAAGLKVDRSKLLFPGLFYSSADYYPELCLCVRELVNLGLAARTVGGSRFYVDDQVEPIYVYGRQEWPGMINVFPYDGIRLDNKLNLAQFSRVWSGARVKIPKHFFQTACSWTEIPENGVLKFCDKDGEQCTRAKHSVIFGKPTGPAPFLSRCYREGSLIAQELIPSHNYQLVILVVGTEPVAGYVQYSDQRIINDNSVHAPLELRAD